MSDVSSVVNLVPTANEGWSTTLGAPGITAGATTVPLASVTGLTDGSIIVAVIEPGTTNQQVFTGTVDTAGIQITGVKWTRGTSVPHAAGVTIVDYTTGTDMNMLAKHLLTEHTQTGSHTLTSNSTITNAKVITGLEDTNGNSLVKVTATGSAVNQLTIANAATGSGPTLSATGTDTNIDINLTPKGTGVLKVGGNTVQSGAWTSYTPTWTNLSVGDGTYNYSKYCVVGKTVFFQFSFQLGTTSTISSGANFTLPVTAAASTVLLGLGQFSYYDASSSIVYMGTTQFGSTTTMYPYVQTVSGTYSQLTVLSGTAPVAYGLSDAIMINVVYEAA